MFLPIIFNRYRYAEYRYRLLSNTDTFILTNTDTDTSLTDTNKLIFALTYTDIWYFWESVNKSVSFKINKDILTDTDYMF